MSTTLTNGLKLPDKGSVDWYADMQNNYTILDGAVGTIADHTTAIAGKAPSLHTHTKSDVTDLLNSNFIPSANNSYDLGSSSYQWNNLYAKNYYYNGTAWGLDQANVWTGDNTFKGNIYQNQGDVNYIIPRGTNTVKGNLTTSGSFTLMFKDKNNGNLATSGIGYLNIGQNSSGSYATIGVETVGSTDNARHTNSISLKIDPTTNDNTAQFYPVNNNATDLGISTNQWNNLYARRTNTSLIKAATGDLIIQSNGTNKSVAIYNGTLVGDGGGIWLYGKDHAYGSKVRLQIYNTTTSGYEAVDLSGSSLYPVLNNLLNLGTSTNKWKSLNGINPGALSLPGTYQSINDQIKDPNGQLNAIDLNGGSNTWVSDVDCYLYFYIPNNKFTWIRIFWPATLVRCGQTFVPVPNESSDYSGFVPVPANTTVVIQVKGTQAPIFRRSACLGNV